MTDQPASLPRGICVSLPGGRLERLARLRNALPGQAELIEVRLDLLDETGRLEEWVGGWPVPVVATCRRPEEGGKFQGTEEERLRLLQRAAAAGASWVDLEAGAVGLRQRPGWEPRPRFILSRHDLRSPSLGRLEEEYRELAGAGAEAVKLVYTARSLSAALGQIAELRDAARALGSGGPPLIAFSMGRPGVLTRILALASGSFLTYAAAAPGDEVAPGQLGVRELRQVYRPEAIGEDTLFTGLLGRRVKGSLSPLLHNSACQELGLDMRYLPFPVEPEELPAFLCRVREGSLPIPLIGLSVTAPYKLSVLPELDELAGSARQVGAVNTLVRRTGGPWRGYNTDLAGALRTLRRAAGGPLAGHNALLFGAGGAARAVAAGLARAGARLAVADRTAARAEELARLFGGRGGGLEHFRQESFDLVVNATPAGSAAAPEVDLPFPALRPGAVVFDLNYEPPLTPFLEEGRRRGARVAGGLEMLLHQGERQFRLFTRLQPQPGVMERALARRDLMMGELASR